MPRVILLILFSLLVLEPQSGFSEQVAPNIDTGSSESSEDGFVAVEMNKRGSVSGKNLMIAAYAVIFAILLIYVFSIVHREKAVDRAATELEKTLNRSE
ncbi:MAG: hypothetical protein GY847_25295 [Proteobacteria bacterium]|nr:hypothetical protein [Pseudomonadota bacterium]